ncbi:hypothetical protein ACP275_14G082000 [Erythranthe tilingii]
MVEEASSILNPDTNPHASRTKRRKIGPGSAARSQAEPPSRTRWRTEAEQQIYSSKLVDALCHLRRPDSSGATVRDAADRVLAVSAKGRTRWSRAIMSRRLSLRLSQIKKKHRRAAARPDSGLKKAAAAGRKKLPPLQRKVRVLSRLIPGCHKISLPNLLEETTDYIAALEMQVKAMTFLTGLLNGGVVHSGGGGGGGGSLDNSDQ